MNISHKVYWRFNLKPEEHFLLLHLLCVQVFCMPSLAKYLSEAKLYTFNTLDDWHGLYFYTRCCKMIIIITNSFTQHCCCLLLLLSMYEWYTVSSSLFNGLMTASEAIKSFGECWKWIQMHFHCVYSCGVAAVLHFLQDSTQHLKWEYSRDYR